MAKLETEDPRAGLGAKDVTTRSAAARDLARGGTWDDLARLIDMALADKSSAVRLYTAAAAVDIAGRHRGVSGQAAMTDAQRDELHAWVKKIDPGTNPSLLMLLSAAGDASAVSRLGRMLRDPRNGVRAGAALAVRRLVLSGAGQGRHDVQEAARGWLRSGKLPADAVLEVIRLAGDAGWDGLRDELVRASSVGRLHGEAVTEALERLAQRASPDGWRGLYIGDGLDVSEVALEPRGRTWRAVGGGRVYGADGDDALVLDGTTATVGEQPSRLLWARRIGQPERTQALQVGGETLWRDDSKGIVGAVDALVDELTPGAAAAALAEIEPGDGVTLLRARGLLAWRAGDLDAAHDHLDPLVTDRKKPRADVLFWFGRVKAERGDAAGAIPLLQEFLERAGKRAAHRDTAEALLGSLTNG